LHASSPRLIRTFGPEEGDGPPADQHPSSNAATSLYNVLASEVTKGATKSVSSSFIWQINIMNSLTH
jgi:hypothetical protein